MLAAAGAATLLFLSKNVAHGSPSGAVEIREDMVTTSQNMAYRHPLFGVGIGNYYARSMEFIPPRLSSRNIKRDAHNQFLQVLGEMGLTGLVVFSAVLAIALAPGLPGHAPARASLWRARCGPPGGAARRRGSADSSPAAWRSSP